MFIMIRRRCLPRLAGPGGGGAGWLAQGSPDATNHEGKITKVLMVTWSTFAR